MHRSDRDSRILDYLIVALTCFAIGVLFGVVAPKPLHAQVLRKHQTTIVALGTFGGYLGGIWDHDPGGYVDSFKLQPDKEAHFLASVVLSKAVADGTSVKLGFTTCLLAGLAWEAGQARHHGFASKYDATYDLGGCATGALWGRK